MKKLIILAVLFIVIATSTFAQGLNATANTSANMVAALNVSKASGGDMNFGSIYIPNVASTLTLAASSAGTLSPSTNLKTLTLTGTAAKFTVTSGAGSPQVSWTSGPITLTAGSNTMTLNTLTCSNLAQGATLTLTNGTADVYIGGTLSIAANQPAGTYTNTGGVTVTVAY